MVIYGFPSDHTLTDSICNAVSFPFHVGNHWFLAFQKLSMALGLGFRQGFGNPWLRDPSGNRWIPPTPTPRAISSSSSTGASPDIGGGSKAEVDIDPFPMGSPSTENVNLPENLRCFSNYFLLLLLSIIICQFQSPVSPVLAVHPNGYNNSSSIYSLVNSPVFLRKRTVSGMIPSIWEGT